MATTPASNWRASFSLAELEEAIQATDGGLDADIEIARETVPVRVESDTVMIPIGPFLVSGTIDAWRKMLDRERAEAQPLSRCPVVEPCSWDGGERIPFPPSPASSELIITARFDRR